MVSRRDKLLSGIDLKTATGLEIGPLNKPLLRRPAENVFYLDHADRQTLQEKYAGDLKVNSQDIVDVDFVWTDQPLAQVLPDTNFDYLVASHVIEHVPDVIWWLTEIATVLRSFGALRLAIPDKRFSFDFLRPETTTADALAAWIVQQRKPSPRQILEFWGYYRCVEASAAWRGEYPSDRRFRLMEMPAALRRARDANETGAYYDTHCSVFTPMSFVRLMKDLVDLNLLRFGCAFIETTQPGSLEFFVHLLKLDDCAKIRESWDWAEWWINRDHVDAFVKVQSPPSQKRRFYGAFSRLTGWF